MTEINEEYIRSLEIEDSADPEIDKSHREDRDNHLSAENLTNGESNTETEYTKSLEDEARELGWRAEDEYDGDKRRWVDAKTYLNNGSFIRRFKRDAAKIQERDQVIESLVKSIKTSEELAYQRAKEEIQYELQVAKNTGDFDAYERAIKKQQETSQKYEEILKTQEEALKKLDPINDYQEKLINRCPFFNQPGKENEEKTKHAIALSNVFAQSLTNDLLKSNPRLSQEDIKQKLYSPESQEQELAFIERGITKMFGSTKKESEVKESKVEAVARPSGGAKKATPSNPSAGLSDDQRIARLPSDFQQTAKHLKNNTPQYLKEYLEHAEKVISKLNK